MIYYKTYNVAAIFFLIVFSGFVGMLFFGSEPQHAEAVQIPQQAVAKQTLNTDNGSSGTNLVGVDDVSEGVYPIDNDRESLFTWNPFGGISPIEISSSAPGSSTDFTSEMDLGTNSGTRIIQSGSADAAASPVAADASGTGSAGSSGTGTAPAAAGNAGSSGTSGSGSPGGGSKIKPDYSLPDWIKTEGIRAGFMSSTYGRSRSISSFVEVAKNIGLNTAIVYGCSFAEAPMHLKSYREWLRLCNQAGLHVFAFYAWQPPVGNICRPVVFADGSQGLFPCPLDDKLWQNYLMADMAGKLARLSTEGPQMSFDGFFLDMEMYRTEDLPEAKKHYSLDTCFCDFCFSRFILDCTQIKELPLVSKDRRKSWLSQNGYLTAYHAYLTEQVEIKAEELKTAVHAINPKLLFGVYPALNDTNWVRNAVMRAFGRDSYPVISFTTDTYGYYGNRAIPSTWGAARIPADLPAYFKKYDINGIYAAGYLFHSYKSSEIGTHLIKSCQKAQGYWLFRMPQLLEDNIPESEALAGGTQADYLQAIKNANITLGVK
jgi:hypothetical protein